MKLSKYLEKNDLTVAAFCRKSKISRNVITRALAGAEIYLSHAMAIVKGSKNLVTLKELLPNKRKLKNSSPKSKDSCETCKFLT